MTRLEAQKVIEGRLGGRTGIATQIVSELQQAQRELEGKPFLPWFLRAADTISTDIFTLQIPYGFLRELDDEPLLVIVEEQGVTSLVKKPYSALRAIAELNGLGKPQFYGLISDSNTSFDRAELFPRPEQVYTFNWTYYKADVNLSDDTVENAWLYYAPKLLIARAGLQVAKSLRSPEAVQLFASDLLEATKDYQFATVARDMANAEMTMGG